MNVMQDPLAADASLTINFLETTKALALMFDPVWYQQRYHDVDATKLSMLEHFLIYGMSEGRAPNAIFDPSYYMAGKYGEINKDPTSLLSYIAHGWTELRNPSPLLNTTWYFRQLTQRGLPLVEPTAHFRDGGWTTGLTPHPLFEPAYYLEENSITLDKGEDPLTHYILKGSLKRLRTTRHFDPEWYRNTYPDVEEASVDPLMHYLIDGFLEGRDPTKLFDAKAYLKLNRIPETNDVDPLTYFFIEGLIKQHHLPAKLAYNDAFGMHHSAVTLSSLASAPLVSIIITNLNGSHHLDELFQSLKNQSYRNFEIIFVDDGSVDDSVAKARRLAADRIVELSARSGFTGANNAGLAVARGELIALLNNDTRVHENWLEALVARISRDNTIGGVTSKVRFWTKFHRVRFRSQHSFTIDITDVLEGLSYKKVFFRHGSRVDDVIISENVDQKSFVVEIDIPLQDQEARFFVRSTVDRGGLTVSLNGFDHGAVFWIGSADTNVVAIPKSLLEKRRNPGFHIINNAGSVEDKNGMPVDRGFSEVDLAQHDTVEEVAYLCGCSMMIRRDALQGRVLFIDELVAYYEDSELSLRLRRHGYTLVYEPASLVYHKHSATTLEKSDFWLRFTIRNRLLFQYILNRGSSQVLESGLAHLNHLGHWYQSSLDPSPAELAFAEDMPAIKAEIVDIVARLESCETPRAIGWRTGVFNPYWSTLGGGEAHALHVARVLAENGFVDVISTTDFDLNDLCQYFGVAPDNFLKRIVVEMTPAVTAEYDTFVNSCYASSLLSQAKNSYYLVSFPHVEVGRSFLTNYTFVANSNFTRLWMNRYWGLEEASIEVLNPMVGHEFFASDADVAKKQKIILSVGRFASSGHIKSQLEIAQAFREFSRRSKTSNQWKLMLIGSVNDPGYLNSVHELLSGLNFEIITNANFDVVVGAYKKAAIYLHASGIGRSSTDDPELQEHFGMAVAQAVCSRCLPIVYDAAGPADIVAHAGYGHVYSSLEELTELLSKLALVWDRRKVSKDERARQRAAEASYSQTNFQTKVRRIFGTNAGSYANQDRHATGVGLRQPRSKETTS